MRSAAKRSLLSRTWSELRMMLSMVWNPVPIVYRRVEAVAKPDVDGEKVGVVKGESDRGCSSNLFWLGVAGVLRVLGLARPSTSRKHVTR